MNERHMEVEVSILSDLSDARRLQDEIEEALQSNGYGESDIFSIRLALEEALVNAIKHGNQLDPVKRVTINYTISPDQFHVRIEDEGPGFIPEELPDPTDPQFIDRPCGRGVFLIRNYMTSVEYHGRGNVITMSKNRKIPTPGD
ncbi:MAG: ATP-binding protein [Bacteroidales bacterium]|nr:ATP-binding protein [Bacteroidales bacterium]